MRPNGVIDFDARYLLEADDGTIIYMQNSRAGARQTGGWGAPSGSAIAFSTPDATPR